VIANGDPPQHLGTSTDIHMATQDWCPGLWPSCPDCDLLEEQTIGTNNRLWTDDNAIGMCKQQPSAQSAIEWDFRPCDNTPEFMLEHPVSIQPTEQWASTFPGLMVSDRS
jgi:hypothetical protein